MNLDENWKVVKEDLYKLHTPLLIIVVYCVITQWIFDTVCPFSIMFGLPCPACGLTRGCLSILTGHFVNAWIYNATAYLWLPAIAWLLIMRYVCGKKKIKWEPAFITIALITIVYYVYRMVTKFPGSEPMVFNDKNIVTWLISSSKIKW
ncbi:DUF2752 domain-containing protein [Agathobacter sp.]